MHARSGGVVEVEQPSDETGPVGLAVVGGVVALADEHGHELGANPSHLIL
jgi:hypothetical protein